MIYEGLNVLVRPDGDEWMTVTETDDRVEATDVLIGQINAEVLDNSVKTYRIIMAKNDVCRQAIVEFLDQRMAITVTYDDIFASLK